MSEEVELSYADILKKTAVSMKVTSDHRGGGGGGPERWRLPVFDTAAIESDSFGDSTRAPVPATWLRDPASPVLSGITFVPVTSTTGIVPVGATLPTAVIKAESADPSALSDPALGDVSFACSVIEVRTQVSGRALMQSGDYLMDLVDDAQRIAIRQKLLQQVLAGNGTAPEFDGLQNTTNSVDYALLDRGQDEQFLSAEDALEDAGAVMPSAVWVLGRDLHTSASRAIAEPGDGARTVERGVVRLTGTRALRSGLITATTGLLVDLSSVYVAVQMEELLVVDRIQRPGDVTVTRQAFVGLIETRATHIRKIVQA